MGIYIYIRTTRDDDDARAHADTHHTPHARRKVYLMMRWTNTCTHIYVQLIQDHISTQAQGC